MGLCASVDTADDQSHGAQKSASPAAPPTSVAAAAQKPASEHATTPRSKTAAAAGPAPTLSDDDEYRSQLKSIFLHLLDRLLQVMEHERESVAKLASLRGADGSYLALFGGATVESFLRASFDLESVARVPATASVAEREQGFTAIVKAAQQQLEASPAGVGPQPSRSDYTKLIKGTCKDVQAELQTSASTLESNAASFPRYAELKKSLALFTSFMAFTKGDIESRSDVLDANINEIINASAE